MNFLEARVLAYYMMEHFIIPYFTDEYDLELEYHWGDHDDAFMDLFNHWYKITLQQAILFQRESYDHFVDDEDIISCEWMLKLLVNSCNGALINSIEEKY